MPLISAIWRKFAICWFAVDAMERWRTEKDAVVFDARIFRVHQVERFHPQLGRGSFVVLDSPNWVHIIPVTADGYVVFVRQYRHGIDDFSLEVPSGLIEPGETPAAAARRECLEETGYEGQGEPELLGVCEPNPAFLNNRCYTFVWYNCRKVQQQQLDRHEEIEVVEIPKEEVVAKICNGQIRHSLMIVAFAFWFFQCRAEESG